MKYVAALPNRSGDKGVLTMRYLVAVLLALLVGVAYSQPTAPSPAKGAQQPQSKPQGNQRSATADQRGTGKSPLVIELLPPKNADEIAKQQRDNEYQKYFYDRLIAWSTVALASVTTLLALFTARLWLSTKALVEDAKDTAERELRAYVTMVDMGQGVKIDATNNEMVAWFANPHWRNNGQTPARHVTAWIMGGLFEPDIPRDFDFPKSKIAKNTISVIGPNSEIRSGDVDIPKDHIAKILSGTGKFYVWGRAEYDDVFEGTPRRHVEFCYQVVIARISDLKELQGGTPFEFNTHDQHNGDS